MNGKCEYDPTHRTHHVDKSLLPSLACKKYLETSEELKGHDLSCQWEGYISVKKCGCVKPNLNKEIQSPQGTAASHSKSEMKPKPLTTSHFTKPSSFSGKKR